MLVVCKGLEKHATKARVKVEIPNLYVKLFSTGKMITKESLRYVYDFCYCKVILSPLVSFYFRYVVSTLGSKIVLDIGKLQNPDNHQENHVY